MRWVWCPSLPLPPNSTHTEKVSENKKLFLIVNLKNFPLLLHFLFSTFDCHDMIVCALADWQLLQTDRTSSSCCWIGVVVVIKKKEKGIETSFHCHEGGWIADWRGGRFLATSFAMSLLLQYHTKERNGAKGIVYLSKFVISRRKMWSKV